MDGGAWWATVHGVAKSQTPLSNFPKIKIPRAARVPRLPLRCPSLHIHVWEGKQPHLYSRDTRWCCPGGAGEDSSDVSWFREPACGGHTAESQHCSGPVPGGDAAVCSRPSCTHPGGQCWAMVRRLCSQAPRTSVSTGGVTGRPVLSLAGFACETRARGCQLSQPELQRLGRAVGGSSGQGSCRGWGGLWVGPRVGGAAAQGGSTPGGEAMGGVPGEPLSEESRSVVSDSLRLCGLYSPWNSPGQNTGVGSLSLLQGSSQPRDRTQVSHIAGGFFSN